MKYMSIYNQLCLDNKSDKEKVFLDSLIKTSIEVECGDNYLAQKSYKNVIDNLVIDSKTFPTVFKLSVLLGKFKSLLEKTWNREYEVQGLDLNNIMNLIFYEYYISLKKNIKFNASKLSNMKLNDLEKSIFFYLIASNIKDKELEKEYILASYKLYNKNLASALRLFKMGGELSVKTLKQLFKIDINLFYESKVDNKDDVNYNVRFVPLGGGNEIGASSYLLEIEGHKFLIDAGVKFSNNETIYPNFLDFEEDINEIEAVIITHAHLDHCGGILKLYKMNSKVKFIMTRETRELLELNLKSGGLSNEEKYILESIFDKLVILEFNQKIPLSNSDISIELYRAGHILGAASILIKSNNCNIYITGDYCLDNQKTIIGAELPKNEKIDILITENTYGNKEIENIRTRELEQEKLREYVLTKINEGKKILIPSFAIGRAQELIMILKDIAKEENFRIYVDGIAIKASEIYEKYSNTLLKGKNVYYVKNMIYNSKDDFILEEFSNNRSCVITSSGMVQEGSTSAQYAKHLLPRDDGVCILTGYQADDTLGAMIKSQMKFDKNRYVVIEEENYKINSELEEFQLSAHCTIDEILAVVSFLKPRKVILVHGNSKDEGSKIYNLLNKYKEIDVYQSMNNQVLKF